MRRALHNETAINSSRIPFPMHRLSALLVGSNRFIFLAPTQPDPCFSQSERFKQN